MPVSSSVSKLASTSTIRTLSSGWTRFTRAMRQPQILRMVACAIVLLVLVVLVGMVCLAARRELFVGETFVSDTGTATSTNPTGSTSNQCNDYAIANQCNNKDAAGRRNDCSYYLRDQPIVYTDTLRIDSPKDIQFCNTGGVMPSSATSPHQTGVPSTTSATSATSASTPEQMMKTCNTSLDHMLQEMQNEKQQKLNAVLNNMQQQLSQAQHSYDVQTKQNTATVKSIQSKVDQLTSKNTKLDHANAHLTKMNTAMASTIQTLETTNRTLETTNQRLDTANTTTTDQTEGFASINAQTPIRHGPTPHCRGTYRYTPTETKTPCSTRTVSFRNKPSLYPHGIYIQSPSHVQFQETETTGPSDMTSYLNQHVRDFTSYANQRKADFNSLATDARNKVTYDAQQLHKMVNRIQAA